MQEEKVFEWRFRSLEITITIARVPSGNLIEYFYRTHWGSLCDGLYQSKPISRTYNTLQSSQPSYMYPRQLFTIQPSRSTRSSSALTLLSPSVTSSLKFANRSIAAVLNLWAAAHWWAADLCLVGRDLGWELRIFLMWVTCHNPWKGTKS